MLFLAGARQLFVAARRYRQDRASGLDAWSALEEALMIMLPRLVAKFVVLKVHLWTCLARWALRRTERCEGKFGYHRRSPTYALVVPVLLVSPVEAVVLELLLRIFVDRAWVEVVFLVVELYAAFWVVGLHASLVTLPHRLEEKGVLLRYGAFARGLIPYSEIKSVERERKSHSKPGSLVTSEGLRAVPEEDAAYFAIAGGTNVLLKLKTARPMKGLLRAMPVTNVRFAADEPEGMACRLCQRIEATTAEALPAG